MTSGSVLLLAPILACSLPAQGRIKLEPLPEMRAAEGYETVSKDRRMSYLPSATEKDPKTGRPKMTPISYGEHKFLKATLEGKTVYLHRYWEELPRLDLKKFEIRTSFTLYDEKLQFVVQRKMQQLEDKTEIQELRWREGKLYRKVGRKEKALPTTARPQSLLGVMILEARKNKSKRTVQVLIGDKVEPVEILMLGMSRGGQGSMMSYSSTGAYEGKWWVSRKEGVVQIRLTKPALAVDAPKTSRAQCGLALDRARVCSQDFFAKAQESSKGKKASWRNKFVGMRLRLPKKTWEQDDKIKGQVIFSAGTKRREAAVDVWIYRLPYSCDFDGLVEARINTERPKAKDREIAREDVEVAGRDAVRVEYDWVSQNHPRHETAFFFEAKGCFVELKVGVWSDIDYDVSKDLAYILKHLKLDKLDD